jgi:hypothetical protein
MKRAEAIEKFGDMTDGLALINKLYTRFETELEKTKSEYYARGSYDTYRAMTGNKEYKPKPITLDQEIAEAYNTVITEGYRKLKPEFQDFEIDAVMEDIKDLMWAEFDAYIEWVTEEGE